MDFRKLEIFEAVSRLQSFSRAAEELHMAQPAVSIAVRKLEEELENPLLERQGRVVKLTAEGRETLLRARAILSQAQELKEHIQGMGELSTGELTLACPSMFSNYFLADVLQRFLKHYTGVRASVVQAGTQRIEAMLLNDETELGVIIMDGAPAELEIIPLVEQHLVACIPNRHRWSKKKQLSVNELASSPMVLYKTDYFVRQQWDKLCAQQEVIPDIRLETNSLPLINRTVRQGLGASVALSMMAGQEPGIKCIPIVPRMDFRMGVAQRRGRPLSRANRAFIEWLSEV